MGIQANTAMSRSSSAKAEGLISERVGGGGSKGVV